jgi:hypothetical protein
MSPPILVLAALVLVLAGIFVGSKRGATRHHTSPDVDDAELAKAEEDLKRLDAGATPEDAEEDLDDWGPGAPRS